MVVRFLKFALIVCLAASMSIVATPSSSFAQGESQSKPTAGGPRRQLATILFAGLGGAILGLSTLSFYGRPQDKLENIAIGFAVGVIAGTGYVTYTAATRPEEFYAKSQLEDYERSLSSVAQTKTPNPFKLGATFTF